MLRSRIESFTKLNVLGVLFCIVGVVLTGYSDKWNNSHQEYENDDDKKTTCEAQSSIFGDSLALASFSLLCNLCFAV